MYSNPLATVTIITQPTCTNGNVVRGVSLLSQPAHYFVSDLAIPSLNQLLVEKLVHSLQRHEVL